ncbi:phosphoinositide phospholipase C 2-like, partial [Trifolium medium]|nr:phosphoinositide phospholipase C 2-like [Trifolium medium]
MIHCKERLRATMKLGGRRSRASNVGNKLDKDIHDEEELSESDKSHHNVAPEYKGLIAIHAGKSKGGIEAWFKVDPDKAK